MRYDLDSSVESTRFESQPPLQGRNEEAIMGWSAQQSHRIVRLFVLLIIFGLFALIFAANFRVVVINGHSMEPTYRHGERVLMTWNYWLFGPIRKGDVVVIELPGGTRLIKRVVAMEGEEVPRQYWGPAIWRMGPRVPPGHVYVVGDNLAYSEDSRQYGAFPISQVRGKIVGSYQVLP
jgi:signal peptidase I